MGRTPPPPRALPWALLDRPFGAQAVARQCLARRWRKRPRLTRRCGNMQNMQGNRSTHLELSANLLEAIRTYPLQREVEHCGQRFLVSPFDVYTECPHCRSRIKIRSFSGVTELEDVFDAVFEWLNQPE